jgi:hypothetical protein
MYCPLRVSSLKNAEDYFLLLRSTSSHRSFESACVSWRTAARKSLAFRVLSASPSKARANVQRGRVASSRGTFLSINLMDLSTVASSTRRPGALTRTR